MVSLGMKIVYNQSVHCDKCNFRKKQNIFETMRFLRYWQLPWYVPLPRMFPSTNLFLWILTTTITSQVPLPIVGWETWLTSSSLACHINRGIPSCAIHLTSCILNHGSPLHNVQFVKYDAPVSKMSLDITCIFMYMIQGRKGEITDLEFNKTRGKLCRSL